MEGAKREPRDISDMPAVPMPAGITGTGCRSLVGAVDNTVRRHTPHLALDEYDAYLHSLETCMLREYFHNTQYHFADAWFRAHARSSRVMVGVRATPQVHRKTAA